MPFTSRISSFIRNVIRKRQVEQDLNDELRAYVDELTERHLKNGLGSSQARRRALLEAGGMEQLRERVRYERVGFGIELWMRDLGYALRSFRRSPGIVAVVILTLGLGIGAVTALFSLVDAAVYRKLAVQNPDELVTFEWRHFGAEAGAAPGKGNAGRFFTNYSGGLDGNERDMKGTSFSLLSLERFRSEGAALANVFAFYPFSGANASIDARPDIVSGQLVSGNYYQALGVPAAMGRTISEADNRPGANPVAVVTHRYWKQKLASDPAIIGKTVIINGVAAAIIGVSPQDFEGTFGFGLTADFSLPLSLAGQLQGTVARTQEGGRWWLRLMGRSKPGVGFDQLRAGLEPVFQLSALDGWNATPHEEPTPQPTGSLQLRVFSGNQGFFNRQYQESGVQTVVAVLAPMFATLLLIVCMNISNLLLARATAREREVAVRRAIGAGRGRLIRQFLTEALLLSAFAGVAGVALAYWLKDILWSSLPDASRLVVDLKIDLRVMGFTALVSLAAGVLFGIVPAFRGSRADIELALKSAGHKFTPVRSRAAKCLLAMQIAMSLVLVIGAGLFLQTLHNLKALAVGFNPENVLLFQISPRSLKYDNVRITALYEQMLEGIAAVPGVVGISRSSHELVSYFGEFGDIRIEGAKPGEFGWHDRPNMDMNGGFGGDSRMPAGQIREQTIHWNLFDTLGVRLLAGRGLRDSDDRSAPRVAVVNEAFATQFFPAQNPIGRRFEDGGPLVVEIVGIVTDIGLARGTKITPTPPTAYLSDRQKPPQGRTNVVVRTAVDPLTLVPAIRDAMRAVDPAVPLSQITTQVQQIESSFALQRALTVASNFFGVVALLLVSIGLYGVMSFSVVRRTNEIGVRMALGAQRIDIAWLVQREIVGVAFAGVALGLGVWFAKNNVITTALFGVPATDTLTLLSSALLMLILALIAGYLPSRRATRVDPIIALRHE